MTLIILTSPFSNQKTVFLYSGAYIELTFSFIPDAAKRFFHGVVRKKHLGIFDSTDIENKKAIGFENRCDLIQGTYEIIMF